MYVWFTRVTLVIDGGSVILSVGELVDVIENALRCAMICISFLSDIWLTPIFVVPITLDRTLSFTVSLVQYFLTCMTVLIFADNLNIMQLTLLQRYFGALFNNHPSWATLYRLAEITTHLVVSPWYTWLSWYQIRYRA